MKRKGLRIRMVEGHRIVEDLHKATLRETAYHEAGHAVVAMALNKSLRSVSIVPDKEYLGCVNLSSRRKLGRRLTDLDRKHLIIDLAGPLSERKARFRIGSWTEREIWRALDICEGRYTKEGRDNFDFLPEKRGVDRLGKLIVRTRKILDAHWTEVKLIANALLKEKTLTRQKVRRLLEGRGGACQKRRS